MLHKTYCYCYYCCCCYYFYYYSYYYYHYYYYLLTPWSRVVLEKLTSKLCS